MGESFASSNKAGRHIQDFENDSDGKTIFSVINCRKAYCHIPVNPDDIEKTDVITAFGLFEFRSRRGLVGSVLAY